MAVQFGSQVLTMLRLDAIRRKVSHAIVFIDFHSAFYRAVRSRIVADRLGFQQEEVDENIALSLLARAPALDALGANALTQASVQRALATSWSQVLPQTTADLSDQALLAERRQAGRSSIGPCFFGG